MHKYWEISKTYMKTQLVYRLDIIFNMLFTVTKILFAYLLWGMVFKNKDMAGMFTFHSMVSYYIISSFLSQLEMWHIFKVYGNTRRHRKIFPGNGIWGCIILYFV